MSGVGGGTGLAFKVSDLSRGNLDPQILLIVAIHSVNIGQAIRAGEKEPVVQQGPLAIFKTIKIPGEMTIGLQIEKAHAV